MYTDTVTKEITKIDGSICHKVIDMIALEKRIRIKINGQEIMSLYCTPIMVKELVVGFFMTEGVIEGNWCADRITIKYEDEIFVDIPAEGKVITDDAVITSGCIGGITFPKRIKIKKATDDYKIDKSVLCDLFRTFQNASVLYKYTGCVHSAALSDGNNILCLAEDIGRHNAVDKVIGYALLEGVTFENKIMLASGRLSSEIVSKCAKWQIPIVASRTSPTSLAIDIAEKANVTVVGFVRGKRLNIYTAPQRIIVL